MSNKIQHIKVTNMRNAEHVQFNAEHIALLDECDPQPLNIKALYDEYVARYNDEDEAYKKIEKSDFTHRIWEADHERDNVFGGLVLANKSNAKHFVQEIRDAAIRIQLPLDSFGNVSKEALNEQTADIVNLLQDLRGTYAADVQTTGIQIWVDELERTNNAVVALVKERDDEAVEKTTMPMKKARAAVDAAYHAVCNRVNALVEVEGPDNYATYIAKLNTIIHRYMQTIKVREGRNAKKRMPDE